MSFTLQAMGRKVVAIANGRRDALTERLTELTLRAHRSLMHVGADL